MVVRLRQSRSTLARSESDSRKFSPINIASRKAGAGRHAQADERSRGCSRVNVKTDRKHGGCHIGLVIHKDTNAALWA